MDQNLFQLKRSQEITAKNHHGGPTANGRRRHGFHGEGAAAHLDRRGGGCCLMLWGIHRILTVLVYMVCHGSHQYTPAMLALIYHHGSVMGNNKYTVED